MRWFGIGGLWDEMNVNVYVPSDFVAEQYGIDVAAGTIKLEDIQMEKLEVDMSAGTVKGENIVIKSKGSVKVNAGTIRLNNAVAHNIELKQNAGTSVLDGTFTGKLEAKCNAGTIRINSELEEKQYNFELDSNAGSIAINENKFSNTEKKLNNSGENEMMLETNAGSIYVSTK